MSPRDLAFVGCRLLALYIAYGVVHNVPINLISLADAVGSGQEPDLVQLFYPGRHLLPVISLITGVAAFLLLWAGAPWLSGKVAEGAPAVEGAWSPRTLVSVAVIFFGLILLIWTIPAVLNVLHVQLQTGRMDNFSIMAVFVRASIGIGCVLGAQGIANFIAKLRSW